MSSIRELEDLIIDAIYLDVLRARLDQSEQQLQIEYTMGRDLDPEGGVQALLDALKAWAQTTHVVLQTLDEKIATVSDFAKHQLSEKEAHDKAVQSTLKTISEKKQESKGGQRKQTGGERETKENRENMMDVDEPMTSAADASKGKTRK